MNVNLRLLKATIDFLWWWGWSLHSHFRIQPNYSVEVVLCCRCGCDKNTKIKNSEKIVCCVFSSCDINIDIDCPHNIHNSLCIIPRSGAPTIHSCLGSISASIHDAVRLFVCRCVVNNFLVYTAK